MAKTLEAHDKLIREIFEGSYQFEIPDYQRPYAWTTEQATELFDDLYSAMQDARVSGASSQYFLGSIVLIKNDRDPKSSVVDGQQRLSTLTMLFAVLRTVMPDAADDITDFLYKKGKVSLGEKNEYRLTAREEDADFFRTNIQEPGGIAQLVASTDKLKDSRLRYRENATLLLEKAKALPPADTLRCGSSSPTTARWLSSPRPTSKPHTAFSPYSTTGDSTSRLSTSSKRRSLA